MNFYETITKRRTVRTFVQKEVDMSTIMRIINAGIAAPTNDHLREWNFLIIDGVTKRNVAELVNIPDDFKSIINSWSLHNNCQQIMYEHAFPLQSSMINECNKLLIVTFKKHFDISTVNDIYQLNCYASIWCCIENMLLAITAEDLNYGIRIPELTERNNLKELLGIPYDQEIAAYIALGYSNSIGEIQFQKNIEGMIHINNW